MPLDARKLAHISQKLALLLDARAQTINLTCKRADGSTYLLQVTGIVRPNQDGDPSLDPGSATASPPTDADAFALIQQSQVDLPTLRSAIYLELAAPQGAQPATRYLLTSIAIKGLAPGGDRYIITLERQR